MARRDVVWLEEVGRGDGALVGGKAANLGELLSHGFPVPPGFVVTAPACRRFFETLDITRQLAALSHASQAESEAARAAVVGRIRGAPIAAALEDAIVSAHAALSGRCGGALVCAVRSSATAEDLEGASFAGQHGTYYYVDGDQLVPMVRACWASLWSAEAVSYRATNGMDHASTFMAVLVQRMIPSEVSGVTFTVNPVTGARDEVVVESSWGMGAGIVDGRVTPDRFVLRRHDLSLKERRIAHKRVRVSTTLRADAVGRVVQVPTEQRLAATLATETVVDVARWAMRAEEHFGAPQDVEWAVAGGSVYVLQSRPVTVSGRREFCRNTQGRRMVLFKPLFENFTDPLTPLTASLFLQGPLADWLALVGGRVYMDVGTVLKVVPLRMSEDDLARYLYLSDKGTAPRLRLSLSKLPGAVLFGLCLAAITANLYARTERLPRDFLSVFRRAAEAADADDSLGVVETFRGLLLGFTLPGMLLAPAGRHVMGVNGSAVRHFVWLGLLARLLKRYAPDLPRDAVGLLTSGAEDVLSAVAGRRIAELAREARGDETVRRLLLETPPGEVLERLRRAPEAAAFVARLDAFLAVFGHRALKEFELRAPRWEEEPAPVLGMVRNYLLSESDPAEHERSAGRRRDELARLVDERLALLPLERLLGLRRRLVRHVVERAKYYSALRENSRFYWIMGVHVVRKKVLRLEARLLAEGRLKCRDDVFFLECSELEEMARGALSWGDVEERIAVRRREHVRLSKVAPPRTIGMAPAGAPGDGSAPEVPGRDAAAAGDGAALLRGQTASAGRAEGVARVILDPAVDAELRPGEILVAPYTDPAWTPLFLTAAAAVVEVGSFLSHAGTVAREYGLPCVVDVPDCVALIATGDRLLVDGDEGTVRVLSRAEVPCSRS